MSNPELEQEYKNLVSKYHRNRTHYGVLEQVDFTATEVNRSCGDTVNLHLEFTNDIIKKASFSGDGCSVSQSSAEIMCSVIEGRSIDEAKAVARWFLNLFQDANANEQIWDDDLIMQLKAYLILKDYPMRQKCARMAWEILNQLP
jgi:nitrogen fixation NifU-like protein